MPVVLAADLGRTNLRMAEIDRQGTLLYQTRRETLRAELIFTLFSQARQDEREV